MASDPRSDAEAVGPSDAVSLGRRQPLADVLDAYRYQMGVLGLGVPPPLPAVTELTMVSVRDTVGAVKRRVTRWRC